MIETLPVLMLRNTVLFPQMGMPMAVARPRSIAAVESALAREDKTLVCFCQRDPGLEDPTADDLYPIGTRAVIKRMARSGGPLQLILQGSERVRLVDLKEDNLAEVEILETPTDTGHEVEALHAEVVSLASQVIALAGGPQLSIEQLPAETESPIILVYFVASVLSLDVAIEQALLAADSQKEALELLHETLTHEVQVLRVRRDIASQVQSEMTEDQRKHLLRRQLRAIQQELGEEAGAQAEVEALRERLEKTELPDEVRKEAERELEHLGRIPPAAPDYQVTRSHLDLILELPWTKLTEDRLDLKYAREVLDEDHYDLQDVKDRMLEHLAVMKLNPEARAPILCLVGPPGVGKTSLGRSVARALGRQFERFSLGGLHDESELRGHRRTYVGAMPGRLIQAIRRAGARNPVLMLDEIDKLGKGYRGDPAAALLEILDPAQNDTFRDNYLDLPFDLSRVFFITTANTLQTVPQPLQDRMEVLRLSGYTTREKEMIARRYLIPRQFQEAGLKAGQLTLDDEALRQVIGVYTREAGVRQLERALGRLARRTALELAEGSEQESFRITTGDLKPMLGKKKHRPERAREPLRAGEVAGMAWTETGGDILYVEALVLSGGEGKLTLTGQLGDVMKESAQAARSFVSSRAVEFGIPEERLGSSVHIHVPAGAIPKDGPSAGLAMATALVSAYTDTPARRDTAMTGEITLTGLVLPVGGIKEKVLAADRAGMTRIILPQENEEDLDDLPQDVRERLDIVLVRRLEDALAVVLPKQSLRRAA